MTVSNVEDLKSRHLWTGVVAEFLGTLLLIVISCGACHGGNEVQISLSFGFAVATVVWAIGHVSGGHINPSVTMGFLATRRITIVRGLLYIVAQMLGGIAGAGLVKGLSAHGTPQGTVGLATGISAVQGFGVEFIVCFVLVFTVFSCVDGQRSDLGGSVPLTVGLAVTSCHLWAVARTGCGMNPARAFGPAVVNGAWDDQWLYVIGPWLGGAIAGWLYEFVFATNATPSKLKAFFTRNYDDADFDRHGRTSDEINGGKVGLTPVEKF